MSKAKSKPQSKEAIDPEASDIDNKQLIVINDEALVTHDEDRKLTFGNVVQSVMNEAQFQIVSGHTPKYAIRYKEKGGEKLPYIPHGYTRDQLNKAFGFDWDFEILNYFDTKPYSIEEYKEKGRETRNLIVVGRLTIRVRDPKDLNQIITTIIKTEFGSQALRSGMEVGDALKGASSDALKRCGLALGIGLDLYYNDEQAREQYATAEALKAKTEQARALRAEGKSPLEIAALLNVPIEQVAAWL